ncbi:hypothetical protein TNCV_4424311 [Trichonephila clavipes]|nr:hypothetical protein TNCV_4424311 [Trichonephila clavipes]
MASGNSLPQFNLSVQGGTQGSSQNGQVTTPELAPPLLTTAPHQKTFELSTDLTCIAPLHGGSLVVHDSNS